MQGTDPGIEVKRSSISGSAIPPTIAADTIRDNELRPFSSYYGDYTIFSSFNERR